MKKSKNKNTDVGYQRGDPGPVKPLIPDRKHYRDFIDTLTPAKPAKPKDPAKLKGSKSKKRVDKESYHRKAALKLGLGQKGLIVRNKDGTIDKKETARLRREKIKYTTKPIIYLARAKGGKVHKVDNLGQQLVAKQYGGKIK
tara:strand:+ start:505 stop:930 length:426 start_codon:yes stop_codon:yes gene_type:complete